MERLQESLFPIQRDFAFSPHKRRVTDAGRRSGKTNAAAGAAFVTAFKYPGETIPVFEQYLTCEAANTFWKLLQDIDEKYALGCDFHQTHRICTLPNKAKISLLGSYTIEAADKYRGGKYPLAIIDEAGTFRDKVLEYLLTDVVEPATIDFDGAIIVSGTPGMVKQGPFYEMTLAGSGWEHHHWTLLDNPTLFPDPDPNIRRARAEAWLRDFRIRKKWDENSPRYLREFMGIWTSGEDDLCYPFERQRNVIDALPKDGKWTYALSLDLGFNDPTAFVVWGRRTGDPNYYVLESYEQSELIPSAVAAHVERLRARYTFKSIVADTGGYGKAVAEEMKRRHGIPVKAAAKRDKLVYMEHTAGDIKSGRIKILRRPNEELISDLMLLGWNDDKTDVHEQARDHLPDAFLYGHREINSPGWDGGEVLGPKEGSAEWWAVQEDMLERLLERQHARLTRSKRDPLDDGDEWKRAFLESIDDSDDYDEDLMDID